MPRWVHEAPCHRTLVAEGRFPSHVGLVAHPVAVHPYAQAEHGFDARSRDLRIVRPSLGISLARLLMVVNKESIAIPTLEAVVLRLVIRVARRRTRGGRA
jgi:hypothetical protein